jgi:hypothetical protein
MNADERGSFDTMTERVLGAVSGIFRLLNLRKALPIGFLGGVLLRRISCKLLGAVSGISAFPCPAPL